MKLPLITTKEAFVADSQGHKQLRAIMRCVTSAGDITVQTGRKAFGQDIYAGIVDRGSLTFDIGIGVVSSFDCVETKYHWEWLLKYTEQITQEELYIGLMSMERYDSSEVPVFVLIGEDYSVDNDQATDIYIGNDYVVNLNRHGNLYNVTAGPAENVEVVSPHHITEYNGSYAYSPSEALILYWGDNSLGVMKSIVAAEKESLERDVELNSIIQELSTYIGRMDLQSKFVAR